MLLLISFKLIAVSFKTSITLGICSESFSVKLQVLLEILNEEKLKESLDFKNFGLEESDLEELKNFLQINENDAFLVLASPEEKIHTVIDQIVLRIEHIKNQGIPIDTRLATQSGETKFLRPRPGAARMYPETDIPPIIISKDELIDAGKKYSKIMGRFN